MIAAVEPSRKALLAGVEMIRRVAPCATYLPVAKTIGNCSPKTCLLEYSESFDLVSAVQVIQVKMSMLMLKIMSMLNMSMFYVENNVYVEYVYVVENVH
jgi:hypothetical protein